MNVKTIGRTADPTRDDFVAELTEAAYPVVLRQGTGNNWLDLKLDLWRVLDEAVRKWELRARGLRGKGK